MTAELQRLQNWYSSQCNGDWEHTFGVKVETIDNPGWHLKIDVAETPLEGAIFDPVYIERSAADWVHCKVEAAAFIGHGGVSNLTELLSLFLDWVERIRGVDV
jgi:uncharacterized protein CbrC (UPF0167 family)